MLHIRLRPDCVASPRSERLAQVVTGVRWFTPHCVRITRCLDPERRRVEEFIERVYRFAYHARIERHYPILMSVQNEDGGILAAVGFRFADEERLFLEQYIDCPIEAAVGAALGAVVSRTSIAEVGNLTSRVRAASIFLFAALAEHLQQQSREHVVATATQFLRAYFTRLGLQAQSLARADRSLLPDAGETWGTYYQTQPEVLVGRLSLASRLLSGVLNDEPSAAPLFARLHPTWRNTTA